MVGMFSEHDLNYIELFLASDIKLVRYQVNTMMQDPVRIHSLIHSAISGMIYKLNTFLEKDGSVINSLHTQPDSYITLTTEPSFREAPIVENNDSKKPSQGKIGHQSSGDNSGKNGSTSGVSRYESAALLPSSYVKTPAGASVRQSKKPSPQRA